MYVVVQYKSRKKLVLTEREEMQMAKTVAFINGKGGCGKSTSIFHIAGVFAHRGQKTLVIDLDKQKNTSKFLLIENEEEIEKTMFDFITGSCEVEDVVKKAYFRKRGNATPKYYGVDVLPSDKRFEDETLLDVEKVNIKEKLEKFIKEQGYEWVIVDMPPSNKKINEICFSQIADNVIAPFSSDLYSVDGYADLMEIVNEARKVNEDLNILGIYLSRYDAQCGVDRFIKEQLEEFDTFLDVQIPLMADLREGIMFGRPMSFYKIVSKSRTAYEKLADVMEAKIKELR